MVARRLRRPWNKCSSMTTKHENWLWRRHVWLKKVTSNVSRRSTPKEDIKTKAEMKKAPHLHCDIKTMTERSFATTVRKEMKRDSTQQEKGLACTDWPRLKIVHSSRKMTNKTVTLHTSWSEKVKHLGVVQRGTNALAVKPAHSEQKADRMVWNENSTSRGSWQSRRKQICTRQTLTEIA